MSSPTSEPQRPSYLCHVSDPRRLHAATLLNSYIIQYTTLTNISLGCPIGGGQLNCVVACSSEKLSESLIHTKTIGNNCQLIELIDLDQNPILSFVYTSIIDWQCLYSRTKSKLGTFSHPIIDSTQYLDHLPSWYLNAAQGTAYALALNRAFSREPMCQLSNSVWCK